MAVGDIGKVGARSAVAFAIETTYGTYAVTTTAAPSLAPTSVNFMTEFEHQKLDELSSSRGFSRFVQLDKRVGGTLEMFLHPDEGVPLLINAMGGRYTFNSLTTAGDHSITAGNFTASDTALSLSFWVQKGDEQSFRYVGGVVNKLKISAVIGEPAKLSAEMVFQDSSISAADTLTTSLSFSTIVPFIYVDGVFRYSSSEALAATTTAAEEIQNFELEINNNLVVDSGARELGSRIFSRRPPAGRREITFKVSQRFDTTTTYNRFVQATAGSVELLFTGASITAEFTRTFTIRLPSVVNVTGDVEVGGANEVLQADINYAVLVSGNPFTSTSRELGMTLRNARTTAY